MITAQYFGKLGNVDRYYWVVAQFVLANPLILGPAKVTTTNPLNNDNRVLLKWDFVPGAIYYTVVQTPTSTPPNLQKDAVAVISATLSINTATDVGTVQDWYYPDPSTGGSGPAGVQSFNHRSGNVLPVAGDYDVSMITGALASSRRLLGGLGILVNGAGIAPLTSDVTISQSQDTTLQKTYIYNSGTPIGQRSYLNLIGGAALLISATDNPGQNWVDIAFSSKTGSGSGLPDPTVAKGDLIARNISAVQRLPVGADGQALLADSNTPTGLKWGSIVGATQTPWLQDIEANDFALYHVSEMSFRDISGDGRIPGIYFITDNINDVPNCKFYSYKSVLGSSTEFTYNVNLSATTQLYSLINPNIGGSLLAFARYGGGFGNFGGPVLSMTTFIPTTSTAPFSWTSFKFLDNGLSLYKNPHTGAAFLYFANPSDNTTAASIYSPGTSNHLVLSPSAGGNVGIGIDAPGYALDVVGDCNITGTYRVNGTPISTGSAGHTIQDEGVSLTARAKLNFVGAGVTVTDDSANNASVVTIPGGGSGSLAIQDEGSAVGTQPNLNFVGAGVTATLDVANSRVNVTIPGGSGTGTPGGSDKQIQFNSSGSFAGSANLIWDNTNSRLGVNVASPLYPIHAFSAADTMLLLDVNDQNVYSPMATFRRLGTSVWNVGSDNADSNKFKIATGVSYNNFQFGAKLTINASGQVGIGTINPGYLLDVAGDVNITGTYRVNGVPISTGGFSDPTTTKGDLIARGSAAPATRLAAGADGQPLMSDSTQTLGLRWGGSMLISGNMTFSPDNTYDIGASGATRPRSLYLAANVSAGGSISANSNVTGSQFIKIDSSGSWNVINHAGGTVNGIYGMSWDKTNEVIQITIGGTTRMVWDNSGRVGIGTTTPSNKLVVSNGGACGLEVSPGVNYLGLTNIVSVLAYDRNVVGYKDFLIDTNGLASGATIFKAGGNVGIGTVTPITQLEISGADTTAIGEVGSFLVHSGAMRQGHGANLAGSYTWIQSTKNGVGLGVLSLNPQGGAVGVGTIAPSVLFHAYGGSGNSFIRSESIGTAAAVGYELKVDNRTWQIAAGGSASGFNYWYLYDSTAAQYRIKANVNGNVYLGCITTGGDSDAFTNSVYFYIVEASNQLNIRVKYSSGTVKGAVLTLS